MPGCTAGVYAETDPFREIGDAWEERIYECGDRKISAAFGEDMHQANNQ